MRPFLHRVGSVVACVTVGLAASAATPAHAAATAWVGDAHAAVRLVTGGTHVGEGRTLEAGLEFRFSPGWHGYWRTPGDAGLPPMIDWSGSDNVIRGDVAWPAPTRLVVQGLQNGIYTGHVILPATLVLKTPGQPATIRASVGYAACSNVCVPFQADLSLPVPAGIASPSPEAPLIAAAVADVPRAPAAADFDVVGTSLDRVGAAAMLVIDLRSRGEPFSHPDLFIEGDGFGLPGPPTVDLREGGRAARLSVSLGGLSAASHPLTFTVTDGARAATFAQTPSAGAISSVAGTASWFAAVGSALLGGLILNLMPCVLPVLSIKLMGLIRQAGTGRQAMRMSLLATGLGVVASFLVLAAVLVALRWFGASLGWGIQFQQPWFLAGMASLTVLFAASLFDWVTIGIPSSLMTAMGARAQAPLAGAFLTGAFATLLATPCSAPFVGTAVGFALAQGPAEILGVFLCLGVGMALPYGVAAVFPGLVRWLPRPGPWMVVLRAFLGLMLLGTAVWLVLVLWSTRGGVAAGAVFVALTALLVLRGLHARRSGVAHRWVGVATVALMLAPFAVAALPAPDPVAAPGDAGWQAFDPDALPGLVAMGKTVLVDVTATWCLTCKVNEIAALGRPEVSARLARTDVIRMRADWSRPDPVIAAFLHRFARYGIPLDVVYGPMRPAGEPLPELLTPGVVLAAVALASDGSGPLAASAP